VLAAVGFGIVVWEWDGSTWTDKTVLSPRPPQNELQMVYDSKRSVCVAVVLNSIALDTWEWNGTAWTQRLTGSISQRGGFRLAYDAQRGRTVLYGGTLGSTGLSDTWEYDGIAWMLRGTGGPPGRARMGMTFDRKRNKVVLFGGESSSGTTRIFADTWEWNGTYWQEAFGVASPPPRGQTALAFDEVLGRSVLFGGFGSSSFADTWEWNGTDWKAQLVGAKNPPAMSGHTMAFDNRRARTLLFGMTGSTPPTVHFWERITVQDPQAKWVAFGAGCTGTAGTPVLAPDAGQLPWIGEAFTTKLGNVPASALRVPFGLLGVSKTNWNGIPLPVDLGSIGMPGCTLFTSAELVATLSAPSGVATWTLPIPPEPAFVGSRLWQQAVVLDPGANVLGMSASNAGEAYIGVR
jgi:hypothetical protein